MKKSTTILKLELINNLFLLFELEFVNIYKLFDKSNIEQQAMAVKKLKELNKIINDLNNSKVNSKSLH